MLYNDITNYPYYILCNLQDMHIVVGGDGRFFNDYAIETFLRVAAGHRLGRVSIAEDQILTTSSAKALLQQRRGVDIALVLTAFDQPGGIRSGSLGLAILHNNIDDPTDADADTDRSTRPCACAASSEELKGIVQRMMEVTRVTSAPLIPPSAIYRAMAPTAAGSELCETTITEVNTLLPLVRKYTKVFDLKAIKEFLNRTELLVSIDCMSGVASSILKQRIPKKNAKRGSSVLTRMGLTRAALINGKKSADFSGKIPAAVLKHAAESMDLFDVSSEEEEEEEEEEENQIFDVEGSTLEEVDKDKGKEEEEEGENEGSKLIDEDESGREGEKEGIGRGDQRSMYVKS